MIAVDINDNKGARCGLIFAKPKEFKTGSRGYYGVGKVDIEGKRYQAQIQLVEIHSKPQ